MRSSRADRRKQNTLDKRTTGQTKGVKLPGAEQRAEVTPARDKEQASTELWEQINLLHHDVEEIARNPEDARLKQALSDLESLIAGRER